MTGFKLRDYQLELDHLVSEDLRHGARDVLAVLPCGGGKTPILSGRLLRHQGASVAIAHRNHLVAQMSVSLARNGVRHRVIGSLSTQRTCSVWHMAKFGRNFVDPSAQTAVASVTTLAGMDPRDPWFKRVGLVINDEAHHVTRDNAWGRVRAKFPEAVGVGFTATAMRPDGLGLGRHADGVMDTMVEVIGARELIRRGFLADYVIYSPPNSLDLSGVGISAGGDYSPEAVRKAVHKAKITGDVVQTYIQHARGKLGATFAVDVASAVELCAAYREAGVPAEVITGDTPDEMRMRFFRQFEARQIHQLCCVDILGEGTDIPMMECISMARPTESWVHYSQSFWRPLRPHGDKVGMIFDHVGNVARFSKTRGLPDTPQQYNLDRRERGARSVKNPDAEEVRACPKCTKTYARIKDACPYCSHVAEPAGRSTPEQVEGNLVAMDPEVLAALRGDVARVDAAPHVQPGIVGMAIARHHRERQEAQAKLRATMALWGGWRTAKGDTLTMAQRRWWHTWGVDILTAQTLGAHEAGELNDKLRAVLASKGVQL